MSFRFPLTALALALSPLALNAQATPQCDAAARAANNGTCPAAQTPAQKFPYPGEQPETKAPPTVSTPQPGTAQKFPYPGDNPNQGPPPDDTTPAPSPATNPAPEPSTGTPETPQFPGALPRYQRNPDPPSSDSSSGDGFSSSSSGSSSSSSGASDNPDNPGPLKDEGSSGEDAVKPTHHVRKLTKAVPAETPDQHVAKDISVAEFYMNDQNYTGAYARAKDAISVMPDDPYSHFLVAESARKLGKLDEAKLEYQQVLKLDPIPKQAKAAKAALAEMEGRN